MLRFLTLALTLTCLPNLCCLAQETEQQTEQATADLPDGRAVFDQYIEATGGMERWSQIKTTLITGKMNINGMNGPIEIRRARPGKLVVTVNLESLKMGEINRGTNGDLAWTVIPMQGASILDGKEKAELMRRADFDEELHPEKYYKSIVCTAEANVDGAKCYLVEFTDMNDDVEKRYYDKDSHLLLKTESKHETPLGKMDATSTFSDYREVGGVQMAFKNESSSMGMTQTMEFEEIEFGVEHDSNAFDPPEAVVKLIEKKQARAAEKEAEKEAEKDAANGE